MQIERLSNRKIFVQEVFLSAKELQISPFFFNKLIVWKRRFGLEKKSLKKFKTDIND